MLIQLSRRAKAVWVASIGLFAVLCSPAEAQHAAPTGVAHLPQGKQVNFTHQMQDGGGFNWDIQHYAQVGHGSNYVFSSGMYCQIGGSNVRSQGQGWINDDGDELEIGPYNRNGLNVYRRVKVYKDQPLARWLEVFENPTGSAVTVEVALYSSMNYGLQTTRTDTGGQSFGPKDTALIYQTRGSQCPIVLFKYCGKRSKVRPNVTVQHNQVYARYNLTIPAKSTSILCTFVSQRRSISEHTETLKKFHASKLLRDLPAEARRMIVNFRAGGLAGLDLNRSDTADTVIVTDGGPKYGKIRNASYTAKASFGPIALPAERVIGMVSDPGDRVRFALRDGQVLTSAVPDGHVELEIPTGGTMRIPFHRIRQWSYQADEEPSDEVAPGAMVALRGGDRLRFDATSLKLKFRTRYGVVNLDPAWLTTIKLDNQANTLHCAQFRNGSSLGGVVEPRTISIETALGGKLEIPRERISRFLLGEEVDPKANLSAALLTNEDELIGRLVGETLSVETEFGSVSVQPVNVRVSAFSARRVRMELWDGTTLSGRLGEELLSFEIFPGPTLRLHPAQIVSIVGNGAMPPEHIVKEARSLIALLGAESFKDRQTATEKLTRMGKAIVPILREYVEDVDPEVRTRIEDILEQLGESKTPTAPNPVERGVLLGRG